MSVQKKRSLIPPHLQRGLVALIVLLMGISVARLLTRVHQQEERIEQLEMSLSAIHSRIDNLADVPPQMSGSGRREGNGSSSASGSRGQRSGQAQGARGGQQPPRTEVNQKGAGDNQKGSEGNRPESSQNKKDAEGNPQHQAGNEHGEQVAAADSAKTSLPRLPINQGVGRTVKFTEARKFNLNHVDSATLIRIPGIAGTTASIILRYRQRYGGFYDPWQLQDFLTWDAAQAHMQEWCTQWFTADVADIRHIRINQASVSELRNHPYITYDQAVELVRYRTRHKRIEKLSELSNLPTFSPEEINRLAVYLSFE